MSEKTWIHAPADGALTELCQELAGMASSLNEDNWVGKQLQACGEKGVFAWFLEREFGGLQWSQADLVEGYLALGSACMTTTFVITQRTAACRRIESSANSWVRENYLPPMVTGELFATVGISHLTTSRRHLAKPVLTAAYRDGGFCLDGYSPWVTGGRFADAIVVGATMEDGNQILLLVPTDLPGIQQPETPRLVGLSASRTGEVRFNNTLVDEKYLLSGPDPNVMQIGAGGGTGGLQTSTLAAGLAKSAVDYLAEQSKTRSEVMETSEAISDQWQVLRDDLMSLATGNEVCSNEDLRTRANSLALRATQAALAVAKGAGYVDSHPAGRWCREALFFLVWSCPQPVTQANLCELAGIE